MRSAIGSTLALALGLAAAVALASCGGGEDAKLLPGTTARQITDNLAAVRSLAGEGHCVDAQDAALEVSNQVDELQGIDRKLKEALQQGAEKLNEVVLSCTEATTEEDTEEALPPETETTAPHKAEKEKPGKAGPEEEAEPTEGEQEEGEEVPKSEQEPPKGEAKGHEEAPAPPAPPEHPSGGIGPGTETGAGG